MCMNIYTCNSIINELFSILLVCGYKLASFFIKCIKISGTCAENYVIVLDNKASFLFCWANYFIYTSWQAFWIGNNFLEGSFILVWELLIFFAQILVLLLSMLLVETFILT